MNGDGFLRLSPRTPDSVRSAWLAMAEGDFLDLSSWLVGYNVDVMWNLQRNAAARGVTFNLTLGVVRPPKVKDTRLWAMNVWGADCVISSTQLTPDRTLVMDFLTPSIPLGYIVSTSNPEVEPLSFTDRMTTFLQPFEPAVWGCIGACIVVTGVVLYFLESRENPCDFPEPHGSTATIVKPNVWHFLTGVYRAFTSFFAFDVMHAHTVAGRLYIMVFAFVSLLLVSAYTANLAAFFTRQGQPVQVIGGINDFIKQNKPACIRNSTPAITFMARKYPGIRSIVVSDTQQGLYDALADGRCVGVVNTDVHTRFMLGTSDTYCGLQIVGQTLSLGYYALPFRKAVNSSASSTNPIILAMNLLVADFVESGQATDSAAVHFPTDTEALCHAKADAARMAGSSSTSSSDLL
ncbi:hypothetical protein HXX76_005129 [Chlamydomonas incerta]|uniref:Ionotropic glutamate receptor C-terminal domain-containing protein n=1 Tax=Chlamydomonas incerta TaxID=51695 RepID=A0A835T4A2_CHLIN|nr:hypothetical protein HXX76_005129 [Chlamydomonas incerta]|eukprot:KAG2438579.1 hypothetical protein HXX76_005129 [Chlamydomonas incerta]